MSEFTEAVSGEARAPAVPRTQLPNMLKGQALLLTFDVDLYALGHGQPLVIVGLTAEDRRLGQT